MERLEELRRRAAAPPPEPPACAVRFPVCDDAEPGDPALYPYQRVARRLLADGERKNLLVASPTGSGKTFVIEECARLARAAGERLYVAEPLIALVEQIYARMRDEGGVAMRTGPGRRGDDDAPVTVCTYEVLARAASVEPERLDGCRRVAIDEFHFLGGDRGPVLQEILAHCRDREVVALSGTLPNAPELAAFLSRLNGLPTYVLGASRRPVEISFYYYDGARDRMSALRPAWEPEPFVASEIGGLRDRQALFRLLDQLERWDCYPALVVAFSCKKLDELADWAQSRDLSDRAARSHVAVGFQKLLKDVPEEDRELFGRYRALAERGVAVHHSHAPVPYLELVSWLAERRALKLVFSSSTLSAGINLPVRTVCLAAARVPRRGPDGTMSHEDIDPLLFHQLVGRAGRPGYETVGNCVLLGKGSRGYGSAQALMQCLLPPVVPPARFDPGDVLRALRAHRSLPHEALAVASARDHSLLLAAQRGAALLAEAWSFVAPERRALLRAQAAAALAAPTWPAPLWAFARVAGPPAALDVRQDGFSVAVPESSPAGAYVLTARAMAKKLPFEDATRIFEARAAVAALLQTVSAEEALARDAVYCCLRDLRCLREAPLQDVYEATLRELRATDCLEEDALTPLGAAACEIRTCTRPHEALRALLEVGELDWRSALTFASQILGEGGGGDGERALSLPAPLDAALRRLGVLTAQSWTEAALRWAEGATLVELSEAVPVGCLCRHLLRVSDCCEELAQALAALGAPGDAFELAAARLARGLPFLKRGGWKRLSE